MKMSTLFTRGVVTVRPDASLERVADEMKARNVGAVVVEEKLRPVGIVTDRDLALALGAEGLKRTTPVREVMSPHVLAIPAETDIFTATKFMKEGRVRRLPVVDENDQVVGIVTMDDLLRCLGREFSNLAEGIDGELDSSTAPI